jgi:hypothetical protein
MPVALLPPVGRALYGTPRRPPLTHGPRYVRGRDWSRWHRPRSGYHPRDDRPDYLIYHLWCGQTAGHNGNIGALLTRDDDPTDGPVCGTCEGRALGAGRDQLPVGLPPLRFDPRWITPPRLCPGSRSRVLWISTSDTAGNVGRCLPCGEIVPVRVVGRGYDAWGSGPVNHPPGDGLIDPCPWHAWSHIGIRHADGERCAGCPRTDHRPGCACGWRDRATVRTWEDAT